MSRTKYMGWAGDNVRSDDIPRASGTIFDYSCAMRMNGRLLDLPSNYLDAVARSARLVSRGWRRRNAESTRIRLAIARFDVDDLLHELQNT